jgi:hypothetical protein
VMLGFQLMAVSIRSERAAKGEGVLRIREAW